MHLCAFWIALNLFWDVFQSCCHYFPSQISSVPVKWQFGLRIWQWEEIGKMCTCAQSNSHMPFITKWQTAMYCGDIWCPMLLTLSYFHIISEGALWPSNTSNIVTLLYPWCEINESTMISVYRRFLNVMLAVKSFGIYDMSESQYCSE